MNMVLVSMSQSVSITFQSSIFMQVSLLVFIWGYFTGKDSREKRVSNVFFGRNGFNTCAIVHSKPIQAEVSGL